MADPSLMRGGDYFAVVGAMVKVAEIPKIEFKYAKQKNTGKLADAALLMKKLYKTIQPNFMGMETNGTGKDILKLFKKKYKLDYLKGVSTSSNMTLKARQMGYAMDKSFMVKWFAGQQEQHNLIFPSVPGPDMIKLIDQIPTITAQMTATGETTYKAHRGQHDDLFMAALHCANLCRLFIEQQDMLK